MTITPQRQSVVLLPRLPPARSSMVVAVALSETSALLAGGGETSALTVLVHRLDDPVDARVLADDLVLGVDEDDLEVLVCGVLVDPVGVEDTEIGAAEADSLFGGGFEGALVFELVDTLVGGFTWTCQILDCS